MNLGDMGNILAVVGTNDFREVFLQRRTEQYGRNEVEFRLLLYFREKSICWFKGEVD